MRFFGAASGPNKCPTLKGKSKRWLEHVKKAKQILDAKSGELQVGSFASPDESFQTSKITKAEVAAKRAREALQARMQAKEAKRRISLKAPAEEVEAE